jgi:hypothetical protein
MPPKAPREFNTSALGANGGNDSIILLRLRKKATKLTMSTATTPMMAVRNA